MDDRMESIRSRMTAEQATGIEQNRELVYYISGGTRVDESEVRGLKRVEVPEAGAGSYREAFEAMGYPLLAVMCTSSSAGDWTFLVSCEDSDGMEWYLAEQRNRYPYHGFEYIIGDGPIVESDAPMSGDKALGIALDMGY